MSAVRLLMTARSLLLVVSPERKTPPLDPESPPGEDGVEPEHSALWTMREREILAPVPLAREPPLVGLSEGAATASAGTASWVKGLILIQ